MTIATKCKFNLNDYPFDRQDCEIWMGPQTYKTDEIKFIIPCEYHLQYHTLPLTNRKITEARLHSQRRKSVWPHHCASSIDGHPRQDHHF